VKKAEISRPNLVAAAVRLAGGPAAAARICGISRQTIYDWINERRVERLIDALRLSRASGVAIENLAGDDVEKLATPVQTQRPKRRSRKTSPDSRVSRSQTCTGPSNVRRDFVGRAMFISNARGKPIVQRRHAP
jgi:transposase-like protein